MHGEPNSSSQDITKIQINGLGSTTYTDKVLNATEYTQTDPSLKITGETDRVYARSGPVVVDDRAALRHLTVEPRGAEQTVVWNPWADKAAALDDLGDEEWLRFLCVETVARGDSALRVPPGGTTQIGARLRVTTAAQEARPA